MYKLYQNLSDTTTNGSVLSEHNPFYMATATDDTCDETTYTHEHISSYEALAKLYAYIPNTHTEFTIGNFSFFSIDKIKSGIDNNNYSGKFIDIALCYAGMGHVMIMSYIPKSNNFFARYDGGSNGYEREANYVTYSSDKFDPSSFKYYHPDRMEDKKTIYISTDVQYTLDQMIDIVFIDEVY